MEYSTSDILSHLTNVKKINGGWSALCPAHDDHKNSLSLKDSNEGLLLFCHAGCTFEEVIAAIGTLYQSNGNSKRQIVATYNYLDQDGVVVYQVVRTEPKGFFQRRPDGFGGWINNLKDTKRVLYRLPELIEADPRLPVFIVEGEKDVDRLYSNGLIATTNVGGAGKWRDGYNQYLKDREIVVLPDNDDPGQEHAKKVTKSLLNIAKSIKIVELPGLPDKGDVSDWFNAGGTVDQLLKIVDETGTVDQQGSEEEEGCEQTIAYSFEDFFK
jgi:putative DNA primase/helicase